MSTLNVRDARAEDAEALLELYRQLSLTPSLPTPAKAAQVIDEIGGQSWVHLLVATLDGVVVGSTMIAVVPNITYMARPWAQVENVIVHEAYRRRGVGEALMARCNEIAQGANSYVMQLLSSHWREGAHAFYEAQGLAPTAKGFRKTYD